MSDIERQKEYARKQFKTYSRVEKDIVSDSSVRRVEMQKDYRDTIRNLGIVSAAISAFALPLLDNQKINTGVLIFSISILMINIVVSFWHVLRMHAYDSKKIIDIEDASLPLVRKVKESALKFMRSQQPFNDFHNLVEDFTKPGGKYDEIKESLDELSKDTKKLNYAEDVIVGLLTLAILLFIYSISSSYINLTLEKYFIRIFY